MVAPPGPLLQDRTIYTAGAAGAGDAGAAALPHATGAALLTQFSAHAGPWRSASLAAVQPLSALTTTALICGRCSAPRADVRLPLASDALATLATISLYAPKRKVWEGRCGGHCGTSAAIARGDGEGAGAGPLTALVLEAGAECF